MLLTSNNTREMSDALKRRCLHLYIPYPDAALERRIVGVRVWWIDDRSPDPRKKGAQAVETGRYIVVEGGRRLPKVPE